jgi:molecular chaperone HtpG
MTGLKKVVTNQVIKELDDLSKKDATKYEAFWREFGPYIKQGVAGAPPEADKLANLLRFRTNLNPDTWSSLEDYANRMPVEQKSIYYLVGDDPKSILRSPHLDYFQGQGTEVLLLTEPMDSFMLMGLRKYKDFELKNVAQEQVEPQEKPAEGESEKIAEAEFSTLAERFKKELGERVTDVRASKRLYQSVARLVDPDGALNPEMQRVYKFLGKEYDVPRKILELNPSHPILKSLLKLAPGSDLDKLIIEQIYDNALLAEGLHPDPAGMAPRLQQLIEAALKGGA